MSKKKKVINFQEEKSRRMIDQTLNVCETILDTHEAVLDISDLVMTTDDINYDVQITEDQIIIQTAPKKSKDDSREI